ncbi:MAG: DUF1730 domain-containing protein [Oscillospiraceae bacterium]|nr:DUF1730 domain-containing protein [Oscillospiraceae bacterium]
MDKLKISQLLRENFPAPFGFCSIGTAQPYLNCRALSRIPQDARSVIVLTFPYYTGEHPQRNISRYAMIPDYHLVAGEYLKKLCTLLKEAFPQQQFEAFVDNSPLREVACGQAAGLGVIGDNGLLIHPTYGSYLFLGEIVTDLLIEPDVPVGERCLHCGACRKACPQGALQENGSVELSLCRSHITQKKGELSDFEKEQIRAGGLIWGCDICNDVCPMNRNPQLTPIPEFLDSVLPVMDEPLILEHFDSRPYNYRGRKTILRNYSLLNDQNFCD